VRILCFHGRGADESISTLSSLVVFLGETGSGIVLEPVSKPVLKFVMKPVSGTFG